MMLEPQLLLEVLAGPSASCHVSMETVYTSTSPSTDAGGSREDDGTNWDRLKLARPQRHRDAAAEEEGGDARPRAEVRMTGGGRRCRRANLAGHA